MRIYRITNRELIEKSREFLKKLELKKDSIFELATKITPFEWNNYIGIDQGWDLLPSLISFKPINEINVPNGWIEDKNGFLKPNKRTKIGKEIISQLNEIKGFYYNYPDVLLGIKYDYFGSFTVPMIYKSYDETEYFYKCDDRVNVSSDDFEEVLLSYVNNRLNPPSDE